MTRAEALRAALRTLDQDPTAAAALLRELAPLSVATIGSAVWTQARKSLEVLGGCGCTEVSLGEDPYAQELHTAARDAIEYVGTGEVRQLDGTVVPVMVVRGAGHDEDLLCEVAVHHAVGTPLPPWRHFGYGWRVRTGYYDTLPEGTEVLTDDIAMWFEHTVYRPRFDDGEQLTLLRLAD